MPDLTTHATWWCCSNRGHSWRYESNSERGKFYTVRWAQLGPSATTEFGYTCDCWPFRKSRTCPHVRWAKEDHCQWNGEQEVGVQAAEIPCRECGHPKTVCPQCAGPVEAINVAV